MALLYRFTRARDRDGTGIFTFIITRSVTRDLHRDATTKEFTYGYQRWVISFNRSDSRTLGVHLILRNATPHTRCYVDFSFCLLNREHFSKNEMWSQKQCRFSAEEPVQGAAHWIPLTELLSRKFFDENGEILMDLTISNAVTVYEIGLRMTHIPFGAPQKLNNAETPYFAFGGYEWNVGIHPQGFSKDEESSNRPKVVINRLTGFDHAVRVQYRVVLGDGASAYDSGIMCQISDVTGRIRGFPVKGRSISDLLRRGALKIYVEMMVANAVSDLAVKLEIPDPDVQATNCYDRENHPWIAESEIRGENLNLRLYCNDMSHIPRNHLRYVSWNAYVVRTDTPGIVKWDHERKESIKPEPGTTIKQVPGASVKQELGTSVKSESITTVKQESGTTTKKETASIAVKPDTSSAPFIKYDFSSTSVNNEDKEVIKVPNSPHWNYYIQDTLDTGISMETDIPMSKIDEYADVIQGVPEKYRMLSIQIEWLDSVFLFCATYQKYDDIRRLHYHQMRREISALQAENYALERQLFSYQKSISLVNSRRQTSEDMPNDEETSDSIYERPTVKEEPISNAEFS